MPAFVSERDRRHRAHGALDRLQEHVLAGDPAGFAEVFAVQGVLDFPFGRPAARGREEIGACLREFGARVRVTAITRQTRYETADPDVVIVEWEAGGTVPATGLPYRAVGIGVLKAGVGGIELFRNYANPVAASGVP